MNEEIYKLNTNSDYYKVRKENAEERYKEIVSAIAKRTKDKDHISNNEVLNIPTSSEEVKSILKEGNNEITFDTLLKRRAGRYNLFNKINQTSKDKRQAIIKVSQKKHNIHSLISNHDYICKNCNENCKTLNIEDDENNTIPEEEDEEDKLLKNSESKSKKNTGSLINNNKLVVKNKKNVTFKSPTLSVNKTNDLVKKSPNKSINTPKKKKVDKKFGRQASVISNQSIILYVNKGVDINKKEFNEESTQTDMTMVSKLDASKNHSSKFDKNLRDIISNMEKILTNANIINLNMEDNQNKRKDSSFYSINNNLKHDQNSEIMVLYEETVNQMKTIISEYDMLSQENSKLTEKLETLEDKYENTVETYNEAFTLFNTAIDDKHFKYDMLVFQNDSLKSDLGVIYNKISTQHLYIQNIEAQLVKVLRLYKDSAKDFADETTLNEIDKILKHKKKYVKNFFAGKNINKEAKDDYSKIKKTFKDIYAEYFLSIAKIKITLPMKKTIKIVNTLLFETVEQVLFKKAYHQSSRRVSNLKVNNDLDMNVNFEEIIKVYFINTFGLESLAKKKYLEFIKSLEENKEKHKRIKIFLKMINVKINQNFKIESKKTKEIKENMEEQSFNVITHKSRDSSKFKNTLGVSGKYRNSIFGQLSNNLTFGKAKDSQTNGIRKENKSGTLISSNQQTIINEEVSKEKKSSRLNLQNSINDQIKTIIPTPKYKSSLRLSTILTNKNRKKSSNSIESVKKSNINEFKETEKFQIDEIQTVKENESETEELQENILKSKQVFNTDSFDNFVIRQICVIIQTLKQSSSIIKTFSIEEGNAIYLIYNKVSEIVNQSANKFNFNEMLRSQVNDFLEANKIVYTIDIKTIYVIDFDCFIEFISQIFNDIKKIFSFNLKTLYKAIDIENKGFISYFDYLLCVQYIFKLKNYTDHDIESIWNQYSQMTEDVDETGKNKDLNNSSDRKDNTGSNENILKTKSNLSLGYMRDKIKSMKTMSNNNIQNRFDSSYIDNDIIKRKGTIGYEVFEMMVIENDLFERMAFYNFLKAEDTKIYSIVSNFHSTITSGGFLIFENIKKRLTFLKDNTVIYSIILKKIDELRIIITNASSISYEGKSSYTIYILL